MNSWGRLCACCYLRTGLTWTAISLRERKWNTFFELVTGRSRPTVKTLKTFYACTKNAWSAPPLPPFFLSTFHLVSFLTYPYFHSNKDFVYFFNVLLSCFHLTFFRLKPGSHLTSSFSFSLFEFVFERAQNFSFTYLKVENKHMSTVFTKPCKSDRIHRFKLDGHVGSCMLCLAFRLAAEIEHRIYSDWLTV
jgi:hypothetical protein